MGHDDPWLNDFMQIKSDRFDDVTITIRTRRSMKPKRLQIREDVTMTDTSIVVGCYEAEIITKEEARSILFEEVEV